MKPISLKNLCATTSLLIGLGGMSWAQADVYFNQNLLAAVSSTDVYGLTCPIGTNTVQAFVNDPAADGILITVQVVDPQGSATKVTAPDGAVSVPVGLPGPNAGNYLILVTKDLNGAIIYGVDFDCFAGGVAYPPVTSALVQNQ